MSAELEAIGRLFDAVHRNDVDAYVKCFADDAVYTIANFPPIHGPKEIQAFGARITPMFERVLHDVKQTWQVGNTCVSVLDVVYHKKDGTIVRVPCLDVIRLEKGLVKSMQAYLDASPAFA